MNTKQSRELRSGEILDPETEIPRINSTNLTEDNSGDVEYVGDSELSSQISEIKESCEKMFIQNVATFKN